MKDVILWSVFWVCLFGVVAVSSYFKEQTKQIQIKADLEIKRMNIESEKHLQDSLERISKQVTSLKDKN